MKGAAANQNGGSCGKMNTSDKKESIMEVQRNLRTLYRDGFLTKSIIPDGVYGDETKEAVKEFQKLIGLEETAIVDYETWTALSEMAALCAKKLEKSLPIYPFEKMLAEEKVLLGETSDLVLLIQIMLKELAAYNFVEIPLSGTFDESTESAIKALQQIYGLPTTGAVDKDTWNALATAYNKYVSR